MTENEKTLVQDVFAGKLYRNHVFSAEISDFHSGAPEVEFGRERTSSVDSVEKTIFFRVRWSDGSETIPIDVGHG